MATTIVQQGTLNRLLQAVSWPSFPSLNITAPFVGRAGIRIAWEGNATDFIDTTVGVVTSPAPMQRITVTAELLKSQGLAQLYDTKRMTNALLGNGNVYQDVTTMTPYAILNCGILNVRELSFNGEDASYAVTIGGYMLMNSSLFG
jgi:hypothetical protein